MWEKLASLCQQAEHEVILVAPYIKADLLSELLQKIPDRVNIQCVTRWQASEIALGVNDIEAYDIVQKKGGQFFCNQTLHAKFYRVDKNCLIGSANLTAKALGKSPRPNLELLENYSFEKLKEFETKMLAASILVGNEFKAAMENEVTRWKESNPDIKLMPDKENKNTFPLTCWLPELGMLYPFYREVNHQDFSPAWIETARHDLDILQIPPGLSESNFKQSVATALQCFSIVNVIEEISKKEGISKEQGKNLLEENFDPPISNSEWDTLCKWLVEYLDYTWVEGKLYRQPVNFG